MVFFNFHQTMPCGYSKLVSEDAWQDAKGIRSFRSLNFEKTSKMWSKLTNLPVFGRFLRIECSKSPNSFCILSGIFWHKFRVPTWGSLVKIENHHFWPCRPLARSSLGQKIMFSTNTYFYKLLYMPKRSSKILR